MVNCYKSPGKKRALSFLLIAKVWSLFPASCLERFAFALKWFFPGVRPKIFPDFVTLSRLVNDLFVFI